MMLVFLILSITVLGEGPKNRNVKLPILSCGYNSATTFYPPAIFMASSTSSIESYDGKGEKLTGLTTVGIVIKDQILSEGAFRVIKTLSIKEDKNDLNTKRGPLKKVLKKPIIS